MSIDFLAWFSWWSYLITATIYTALTFRGELPSVGTWVFSKDNDASVPKILSVHIGFLAFLLTLMRLIPLIYPFMPQWLTEVGGRGSFLDVLFIVALILTHKIERKLVYVES